MPSNRILHLEDNANDAILVRHALKRAGLNPEIVVVADASAYRQAIAQGHFDLVLSDSRVPGFSSIGALQAARTRHPDIPFVCVSGMLDDATIADLLAEGVTQYVLKDQPGQIVAAVRQALALCQAQQEARRLERLQAGTARLVTAVQELSLARDFDTIREIVRHAARELTGADGATLVLREGDQCHYVDEDAISPLWKGRRFPVTACISGWAMLNRQAVAIEDIYADARIPADAYRPTFVKSLLMVPIRTDAPLGAIGNYWASPHLAEPREIEWLQALANTTAVALENVRVYTELEQRVRERTTQLEASNRELESFSFSVSHDLRSPLHSIAGFTDLLQETYSADWDDECRGYLTRIRQQAKRMETLIDDFLRLAQISRADVHAETVDLSRMGADIVGQLRIFDPDRVVEFVCQEGLIASGDRRLLRVALENLLGNAWKYTGRRPAGVRIELSSTTPPAGPVIYQVRDNGAGFDPRYAERLFAPFQRLHSTQEFPGSGVGLATVQRIIRKHGGRLWAEAKPGEGATFFFTLAPETAA